MASRFAVGAGTWDGASTAIWSTTTGGATGASAPTAADDVFLDASSGAITIASGAVCRSLNCTGYANTLTHTAAVTLSIGDATAGASNIALKFVAGMTYTLGNAATSAITFATTSVTNQTIDWSTKTTGNVNFSGGTTSNLSYSSGHTTGTTATVTVNQGTVNFNGQTCSWGLFNSSNTGVRTLTFGAAAVTITGTGTPWNIGVVTSLTMTANTATTTLSGANVTFNSGSLDYNGMSLVLSGSGTAIIGAGSAITCGSLTRTGTAAKTDILQLSGGTITTTNLTLSGNSATNRLLVQSSVVGTARTFSATSITATNADFMDITGTGAGSWNLAAITGNSGNCGGNTGITFTTPAPQTWSGTSGGNWSTNAWTTRVPLPQDNVTINNAFSASQTVTADMPRLGQTIDFTGVTGSPTFSTSVNFSIFGSLILVATMSRTTANTITFGGRSSYVINCAGLSLQAVVINAPGGTYTMQTDMTLVSSYTLTAGGFDAANFNMTADIFSIAGTVTRSLTMGTGTWTTLTAGGATSFWRAATVTGLTFSGASSTIAISGTTASIRTFDGGGLVYGTLKYTVSGSTGGMDITGANTFSVIQFSDASNARILRFTAATTTTFTGAGITGGGTAAKLMTISSVTAATHTLTKTSGTVSLDYMSITNSLAGGGSSWYAGANSTDAGGNTGWVFTAPPPASTVLSKGGGGIQSIANLAALRIG